MALHFRRCKRGLGFWAAQAALFGLSSCSSPGESQVGSGGTGSGGSARGGQATSTSGGSQAPSGGVNSNSGGSPTGGTSMSAGGSSNPAGGSNQSGGNASSHGGSSNAGNVNNSGGSSNGGSSTGGVGTGGGAHRDHCVEGYDPDPSDATMADGPAEYTKSGQIDLTVQPGVLNWLQAHVWESAHFQWHNIRRCKGGMVDRTRDGGLDPCKHTELVPADQEFQTAGDGLQFLAMHRHMIQSLKQLFPKHTEQFEGWEHFPTKASDLPKQWQADWKNWDATVAANGAKADDPASHLSDSGFESEGAFGQWIQSATGMSKLPASGLHGALHFKWVRPSNTDHGLGNQFTNIDNYMFWKMHGWIDKVWDRYRAAKGKKPTDPDIKDAVLQQCRQMDQLAVLVKPDLNPGTDCTPAPKQSGMFTDTIRPIFESATNKCTGCHGRQGAGANLTLGGSECVKSSDIVAALVDKPALTGGQFKLVVPGDPDKSWLYLKVTDKAKNAGCSASAGSSCNTDAMPQGGGVTLSSSEQEALRKWIADGAKAPQ